MMPDNARLVVLVTSMLAFTLTCVTAVLGLRLHRARLQLVDLMQQKDCAPPLGRGSSR